MSYKYGDDQVRIPAAAKKPGVFLNEPDTGLINVVAAEDYLDRGLVAGFNSKIVGQVRQLFPRISRADYMDLQLTRLPEAPGELEAKLRMLHSLDSATRDRFISVRKAVKQVTPEGERVIIVPRVPEAMDEAELAEVKDDMLDLEYVRLSDAELKSRRKQRKYSLAQIFNDLSVLEKYQLPLRIMECGKRLAATDAKAAAAMFQDAMNSAQEDVAVRVQAGEYNKDRVQAVNAVKMLAKGCRMTDSAVMSDVIGGELFMYGPGGVNDWHVRGPLRYAEVLCSLYWLVSAEGPVVPSWLLAMECVLLRLEIFDGQTYEEPDLVFHALGVDDPPMEPKLATETLSMLSSTQRSGLGAIRERLEPVLADDRQVATAVRVTSKHLLVNAHVMDANPVCSVGETRLVSNTQISRDLCSVLHSGQAEPWLLRNPVVGERAAIFFMVGAELCVSRPVEVVSVDQVTVITTLDTEVSFGMSGGALVALSDMSLLGVHSAATRLNLLSYRFSPDKFSALLDNDGVTVVSRQSDPDTFADKVFGYFKKRGIGHVLAKAIESLVPVYMAGQHVGTAVKNGDFLYTTCDADMPLRYGSERVPSVAEVVVPRAVYRVPDLVGVQSTPAVRRKAVHYESVFVVGFADDAYVSLETRVVHIAPNSRSFVIDALPQGPVPLTGGLVMAWDGSVLGQCGVQSATTAAGLGITCWPMAELDPPLGAKPRELLQVSFPFLNMACWSDELLEEVFTHSSAGRYGDSRIFNAGCKPLANVGDNVAKAELYRTMRDACVPHSTWSVVMQTKQNNNRFASLAWEFKYAEAIKVGPGTHLPRDSKAYADLTEALLGAACLVEKPEVVSLLCKTMGILYEDRPFGRDLDSPEFLRRG